MKKGSLLLLFSFLIQGLTACGPEGGNGVTYLAPVSRGEKIQLRLDVRNGVAPTPSGVPLSDPRSDVCRQFEASLPRGVQKGYLSLPEDWDHPEGRKIRVFYAFRPGKVTYRPTAFFNGGPTSSSHGSFFGLSSRLGEYGIPMVFVDQRGTGCSSAYPAEYNEETLDRLTHYGTRDIVRDAEAVRKHLFRDGEGAEKWNIFGQSFGGMIVHRYLSMTAESVNEAFSHGASLMSDPVAWLKLRLQSQKRVAEDFFAEFPGARRKLKKIRDSIPADRCFTDGGARACGPSVMDSAVILLGFKTSWSTLNMWIDHLLQGGDGDLDMDRLAVFVRNFVFGVFVSPDYVPGSVITSLEILPGDSNGESCRKALDRLKSEGEYPANWPFNECRLSATLTHPQDGLLARMKKTDPLSLESVQDALDRNPGTGFHVFGGALDVFVPGESFTEEEEFLKDRIDFKLFPHTGHEGYEAEKEIWEKLAAASLKN